MSGPTRQKMENVTEFLFLSDGCRKYDGMALDFKIILGDSELLLPDVAGVRGSSPGSVPGSRRQEGWSSRRSATSAPLSSVSVLTKLQPSPLSSDRWCNSLDNLLELLSADPELLPDQQGRRWWCWRRHSSSRDCRFGNPNGGFLCRRRRRRRRSADGRSRFLPSASAKVTLRYWLPRTYLNVFFGKM